MGPFAAFTLYTALKRHFTTNSYNYVKYNGVISANFDAFEKRKDIYWYKKIANKRDPFTYVIGNLVTNPAPYVTKFTDDNGLRTERYLDAKLRYFEEDLSKLDDVFDDNFIGPDPHILTLWKQGEINIETLAILETIGKFTTVWDRIVPETKESKKNFLLINKYSIFFEGGDRDKYKTLLMQRFKPSQT